MKRWLYEQFLPMWAKETLLRDYKQLRRENARLLQTLRQREAYIKGMHKGLARERILHRTDVGSGLIRSAERINAFPTGCREMHSAFNKSGGNS